METARGWALFLENSFLQRENVRYLFLENCLLLYKIVRNFQDSSKFCLIYKFIEETLEIYLKKVGNKNEMFSLIKNCQKFTRITATS